MGYDVQVHMSIEDIQNKFKAMGGGENFSIEGLEVLFDYLEEIEKESKIESNLESEAIIELDIVAIFLGYTEDNLKNILSNYDVESIEELEEKVGMVRNIEGTDRYVYSNY